MNMKNMKAAAGAQSQELEMTITRLLDVPQKLAFSAWTEPQHLRRWENAPKGFTVSTHEVDFRVGGAYRICMRSPEGVDHWLQGEYREIVKPERLVMTHTWLDAQGKPGKETLLTIAFSDLGGKTRFTLHQTGFSSAGSREGHRDGWNSSIDRFTEYLRTM